MDPSWLGEGITGFLPDLLDAIHDDTINCNFTVSSVITFVSWIVKRFFSLSKKLQFVSLKSLYVFIHIYI